MRRTPAHPRGLSLVDLMVGLAISMAATLVILNVAVMFDARRRLAGGHADAGVNLTHAVGALIRELRMAGSGLGPPEALDCVVHRAAPDDAEATLPWRPVVLSQGKDGSPDSFTVLASGTRATPPARLIAPYTMNAGPMMVDSALELQVGDRVVLHAAGRVDCPMLTVASVSIGAFSVQPKSTSLLPGTSFGIGSALINVGALRYRRYSVDAMQQLQAETFDNATGTWRVSTLADGIASLQLQYGFDARAGAQTSPQVTFWTDQLIDADGNGARGDAGDWRRLLAIRIAIVTRSAQRREGACDTSLPQWLAGASPDGQLRPTPIALDHLTDWRCWRYRVLQTEVLLRNQLWSDG